MSLPGLILLGAGGHARACIELVERTGQFRVAGLIGAPEQVGSVVLGYPVLGSDTDLATLAQQFDHALVALGQIATPETRMRLYRQAGEHGLHLPVQISPGAQVSRHAVLGAGTVVLHGALVNAGARIGANCIINSGAVIEHDTEIGDHCHVSTGAILNGGVRLGMGSFVGSASVIREGLDLGRYCLIGMGQSVRHDVADHGRVTEKRTP